MDTKTIDRETHLALAAGLAAGAMGLVFGAPREAATVAAISSVAGAALFQRVPKERAPKQNRLLCTIGATCLLFLAARGVGQKMPVEVAAAGLAGACGAVALYTPRHNEKLKSLPFLVAMGYSVVSAHLFPTHKPTFANALLLITATNLFARELKSQTEKTSWKKWQSLIEWGQMLAPLFIHSIGQPIGFPIRWRHVVYALVADKVIPPLSNAS